MSLEEFASSLSKELGELVFELDDPDVEECRLEVVLRRTESGGTRYGVAKVLSING